MDNIVDVCNVVVKEAAGITEIPKMEKKEPKNIISVVNSFALGTDNGVGENYKTAVALGLQKIQGALRDSIYARINVQSDGRQNIEFCQKYADGRFSPIMSVKQASLLVALINGRKKDDKRAMRSVQKFFDDLEEEYYGKVSVSMGELLDVKEIATILANALSLLPIRKSHIVGMKREELYREIMDFCEHYCVEEHTKYYALETGIFRCLAESMDLTEVGLVEKLEKENLIYLTESNGSGEDRGGSDYYKTVVRTRDKDGKECMRRRYCIIKLDLEDDSETEWNFDF